VRARRIAEDWWAQPYPAFKRLALFATSHDEIDPEGQWVDWLLLDDGWWLWLVETQRETIRLLVLRGSSIPDSARARLEAGILAGPPRRMFKDDIEPEHWIDLVDHMVWLHLAKLASTGASLGRQTTARLEELTSSHPDWQLAANESDEFSHWMSGTGDPDFVDRSQFERVPRQHLELMEWLQRAPVKGPFHRTDWSELCREQFPVAARALCGLARRDIWPAERWRDALQVWSEEKFLARS